MAERPENPVGALESRLAQEADYNDDSTAKPIARKKKNTRKRRHADNVLNELKEINWKTLCNISVHIGIYFRGDTFSGTFGGVLDLPRSEGQRIVGMYISEEERKSAGVLWWVDHHPLASWRLLITQLDEERKHSLANWIHQYAEKVTDHSFTRQNISMVTASLEDDELADDILQVPDSIQRKIREKTSTSADFREGAIEYYIQYSPQATWAELAGQLYFKECGEAMAAARRFIKRTPETTLNLPNLSTLLERVSYDWYGIGYRMNIPQSKREEIWNHHSGDDQRCSRACWELYLKDHPSPTWKLVAYALYQTDHLEELEVVLKKYLKGSAENLRQFEEAMKHGHIRSWIWKLLLYGAAGSGKSSVKEMILGNPPPVTRTSTPLAMRPTTVYRVNLDGKEFTTITTLQERRAFLAQALLQSAPNLKRRLRAARAKVTSSSNNQPVSTVAVSQVQSKDQASPDQSKPPPLDDQPPSASLLEPASLDHRELDEDIDNEGDDILQLISTDQDLVKMMDRISTTVDQPASFRLLEIVDAGGQPQFHEILPIFLRRLSFYVFVFRLIDDLSTRPVVEYYSDAKAIGSSMTSSQTIEQLLQHCARTMHSHRASQGSEGDCPKIIVIGTHADKVWFFKGSNYDKKNAQILQLLQPMLGKQIIYYDASTQRVVFPVNSRTPASEDWSVIDQVRDLLLGEISIPPADIPARWFALEILLEEMAEALDQGVLSRQDCFTAAMKKLHFEEDAGEFDAAIHYLDELSVLLYYPRILPSVVFADPQVVLDKVTELVIASFERNASKCKGHSDSWRKFYEFALVTVEFLSQSDFNKHYVPGLFDVPDLIKLFKKLLIFAHFSATELLVPALLRDLDKKEVIKIRSSARSSAATPSFTIVFPDGGPRRGIYCSLLCWLVSDEDNSPAPWSIVTNKFGIPTCLHRNCVQFKLHKSPVVVTLIDTYTHFEIHINVPVEFSADLCPKIIPMVSQTIFKGLGKVALNLNYDGSSPSPALVCPCGRGDAHVAATNSKLGYWTCTQNVTLCGKLTSLQLLWLEQVTTDPSEAVEEVTTDPSKAATVALAYDRNTVFTGRDFSNLLIQLKKHATKWRDISAHLGFYPWELDNIQARPFLMQTAPESWLGAMLTEWLQRTPDDTRRSSSIESLTHALSKCGIETKLYDTSEYPLSKLHSSKPRVYISVDPINQLYGDEVTVTADVMGLSATSYQWLKNDKILSTAKYPAYDGLGTNKLTISSFTHDYEGTYQCAVSFSSGEVVKSNHIKLAIAIAGSTVSFTYNREGKYQSFSGDKEFSNIEGFFTYDYERKYQKFSSISSDEVMKSSCIEATHGSVYISVDPINQLYGDKVTVTADVMGPSVASYQWLKNDKVLSSTLKHPGYVGLGTNKLIIYSFTHDYEGMYQCAVSFSGGEVVKSNHIKLAIDLQGVEVLQKTTVTVTNSQCTFVWEGYGLKLYIPENSLPSDMKQITLTIIASIAGHYKFPENFSLFSGIYWFSYEPLNVKLQLKKPVKLEIQHCSKPHCTSGLSFVRASHNLEKLPYTFKCLKGGNFTSCSSYGTLEVNKFCGICIAGESRAKRYLASIFYLRHEIFYWSISIAVTLDDDAHRRASERKFSKKADGEVSIDFESDKIILDIPKDGLKIEGWLLSTPGYPMIKKEMVDNSEIPYCRIHADPGRAKGPPLQHRINLKGAKAPSNYINIFLSVRDGGGGSAHSSSGNTTSDNPPTLPAMLRILRPMSSQWMNIGVMLPLNHGRLTAIETRCRGNPDDCLREMLSEWLQQTNPRPTKLALVDAVREYNPLLAETLRENPP